MKRIGTLDASWLAVESDETPMQVANLQIFKLPKGAPAAYLRDMVRELKGENKVVPPWNSKLRYHSPIGRTFAPYWVKDEDIDLDYHVRHSALPKPGGERELGILVSRLHSNPLDFKRPLWELHIIEGLQGNRFALYTKMHHSLIDGISGVRLAQRILAKDPNQTKMPAPWSVGPQKKPRTTQFNDAPPTVQDAIGDVLASLRKQADSLPTLANALYRMGLSATMKRDELAAPFVGPQSIINGRVTGARRFATQQYSVSKLKEIAKAVDGSLNDIVLYLCGSALRRFLIDSKSLPSESLTAGIPVNIRPADDQGTGTAISFMIASLATNVADPRDRLAAIMDSTRVAKEHLQSLPRSVLTQYTMLMMSPYILQLVTGMGGRMRPAFNVTISNVPGPTEDLYFQGAKLEAMYPVSLIAHGGALNITCLSYGESLNFGYTGCRDTLPSMQNLAVYSGDALAELEKLVLGAKKQTPKARKPATSKNTTSKSRPRSKTS